MAECSDAKPKGERSETVAAESPNATNTNNTNTDTNSNTDAAGAGAGAAGASTTETCAPHVRNETHPKHVRWGVLFFLLGTLVLLVFADFGSGVKAESIMMQGGEIYEIIPILNVSVVSSVGKLWEAESYPLAVFIAITSIGWPYIKLTLALLAWVTPYSDHKRREFGIELIDALGKWSFVDIMVLVEIMVAFRSSLLLGPGLSLEIVIVAQWGFYGFVIATMLSLASTHIILHYHRKVHYHHAPVVAAVPSSSPDETKNIESGTAVAAPTKAIEAEVKAEAKESGNSGTVTATTPGLKDLGGLSNRFLVFAIGALLVSMGLFLAGVLVETFEVTSTRGETSVTVPYSIASIGRAIPEAYVDAGHTGTRFIQFLWFFLGVAAPLLCSALFVALYAIPSLSKNTMQILFAAAEITFAWSCAEVLFVSTIFAVQQMPVFGDGLVENNCSACFLIDTRIRPEFAVLCVGTLANVAVNVGLYRKAHGILYQASSSNETRQQQQ